MEKIYDLIIIGSGSAGLSAGLYAGRATVSYTHLDVYKRQVSSHTEYHRLLLAAN